MAVAEGIDSNNKVKGTDKFRVADLERGRHVVDEALVFGHDEFHILPLLVRHVIIRLVVGRFNQSFGKVGSVRRLHSDFRPLDNGDKVNQIHAPTAPEFEQTNPIAHGCRQVLAQCSHIDLTVFVLQEVAYTAACRAFSIFPYGIL